MKYTVNDVAKIANLSPHTIRFYAKEGLFPNVKRDKNGVRIFEKQNLESVFLIECLKKSGMTLKQIKTFMDWCEKGDATIPDRLAMFVAQKKLLEEKIVELQETLAVIEYKKNFYEAAKAAGTTDIIGKDMPKNMQQYHEKVDILTAQELPCTFPVILE